MRVELAVENRVILAVRRANAQRSLVGPFLVLRGYLGCVLMGHHRPFIGSIAP